MDDTFLEHWLESRANASQAVKSIRLWNSAIGLSIDELSEEGVLFWEIHRYSTPWRDSSCLEFVQCLLCVQYLDAQVSGGLISKVWWLLKCTRLHQLHKLSITFASLDHLGGVLNLCILMMRKINFRIGSLSQWFVQMDHETVYFFTIFRFAHSDIIKRSTPKS